ncbi:MAG TPA: hypothetical protein VER76_00040 [Pyrinomonadaceae bacterium]|nr:hypothetical protein [Pyrinomonadaceae bacterium]
MKKALLLLAVALPLIFLSGSVYTSGLDYDLRGLSPGERMSVLDTTTIGEKWLVVRFGMIGVGLTLIVLAGFLFYRDKGKILTH